VVSVVLNYLFIGFYPFQWEAPPRQDVKNGAVRTDDHALQFRSAGIAHTAHVPTWLATAIESSAFHVSLEVRALREEQLGPARIFTLSLDPYLRNLTVGQERSDLIVRMRNPSTSINGMPSYVIKNLFGSPGWHQIDVSITPTSISIQVDSDVVRTVCLPDSSLSEWSPHYRLALGNELTGNRAWLGDIRKAVVTVGNERFDYLVAGALYVPTHFTVPDKYFREQSVQLIPFVRDDLGVDDFKDWVQNLLGFIPLGWLIAVVRTPRPSIFVATILCAALSVTIELGQIFLPTRIPSADDLILNTLGGTIGAWLATRRRSYVHTH
jgi:hypothetical protein